MDEPTMVPPPPANQAVTGLDSDCGDDPRHQWLTDGGDVELVADASPGDLVTVHATLSFEAERVEWTSTAIAPSTVAVTAPPSAVGRLAGRALVTVVVEVTVERDGVVWSRTSAPRLRAAFERGPEVAPSLWTVDEAARRAPSGLLDGLPFTDPEAGQVAAGAWTTADSGTAE